MTRVQPRVNLRSTHGQPGVNLGSTWESTQGQRRVNPGSARGQRRVKLQRPTSGHCGSGGATRSGSTGSTAWEGRGQHRWVVENKHSYGRRSTALIPCGWTLILVQTARGGGKDSASVECLFSLTPPCSYRLKDARRRRRGFSVGGVLVLNNSLIQTRGGGGGGDATSVECLFSTTPSYRRAKEE
jgi:hypothetical protein